MAKCQNYAKPPKDLLIKLCTLMTKPCTLSTARLPTRHTRESAEKLWPAAEKYASGQDSMLLVSRSVSLQQSSLKCQQGWLVKDACLPFTATCALSLRLTTAEHVQTWGELQISGYASQLRRRRMARLHNIAGWRCLRTPWSGVRPSTGHASFLVIKLRGGTPVQSQQAEFKVGSGFIV